MSKNAEGLSPEAVAAFIQQPVPRDVLPTLRRAALKESGGIGLCLFGSIFFFAGLFFATIAFPWRFPQEMALDFGYGRTAPGTFLSESETNMSENDRRIYEYRFSFSLENEDRISGTCYNSGDSPWKPGESVTIEYLSSSPEAARIEGCRLNPFGYFTTFVLIFPLVGAAIIIGSLLSRRKVMHLLRSGEFATGRIADVESVRDSSRAEIAFSWQGDEKTVRCSIPDDHLSLYRHYRNVQRSVALLVDPAKPKSVLVLDAFIDPSIRECPDNADEE